MKKGTLIGIPFVAYSCGILLVYGLGSILHWRMVAWCGIMMPIFSFIAIAFAPESPTWLAKKGYYDKAKKGKPSPLNKLSQIIQFYFVDSAYMASWFRWDGENWAEADNWAYWEWENKSKPWKSIVRVESHHATVNTEANNPN